MKQFKMLILTDHSGHSVENSLYGLARALNRHPFCAQLDVVSRGLQLNNPFFKNFTSKKVYASRVNEHFQFTASGVAFRYGLRSVQLRQYDVIFLRLPYPITNDFWRNLTGLYPERQILNRPNGIVEVGSKAFLLNFPSLCPPMQLCHRRADIVRFKNNFPIVLKPLRNYGGKGIVKIVEDRVYLGKEENIPFTDFMQRITEEDFPYLGMKFLKNVEQGDKRIVVVDGNIIGCTLRLPANNSWLCNASQGGSSVAAQITPEEEEMVKALQPVLKEKGIVMYGLDTLVADNGQRMLSEINALSIGGLIQMERMYQQPITQNIANLLWQSIKTTYA